MGQPKFVFDNLKDWSIAKQKAINGIKEPGISPFVKREREKLVGWIDSVRPTHQD